MKRNDAILIIILSIILTGVLSHFLVMAQPPKEDNPYRSPNVVLTWNIAAFDAMGEGYCPTGEWTVEHNLRPVK